MADITKTDSVKRQYPLSPKSTTEEDIIYCGNIRHEELCERTSLICAIIATMVGLLFFVTGIVFMIMQDFSGNEYIPIAILAFICCALTIIFCIVGYYRKKNKIMKMDIQQLGQEKLKAVFNTQISNPERIVDIPYYSSSEELIFFGLTPSVCINCGKFENIYAADMIVDEQNEKFAICTLYSDNQIISSDNIFLFINIIGVKLENNGKTVYETKTEDGFSRAVLGYAIAGGVGAMVASNTARTTTTAHTIDSYQVVVTHNSLNRAYLTFQFGSNKVGAENVFQLFSVICERNKK